MVRNSLFMGFLLAAGLYHLYHRIYIVYSL